MKNTLYITGFRLAGWKGIVDYIIDRMVRPKGLTITCQLMPAPWWSLTQKLKVDLDGDPKKVLEISGDIARIYSNVSGRTERSDFPSGTFDEKTDVKMDENAAKTFEVIEKIDKLIGSYERDPASFAYVISHRCAVPNSITEGDSKSVTSSLFERISMRAYQISQSPEDRGPVENWLRAERELS